MTKQYRQTLRRQMLALMEENPEWADHPESLATVQCYATLLCELPPIPFGTLDELSLEILNHYLRKGYSVCYIAKKYRTTSKTLHALYPHSELPLVTPQTKKREETGTLE